MKYKLRIPSKQVLKYRNLYTEGFEENLEPFRALARKQRHLTVDQLYEICRWKSPRRPDLAKKNDSQFVQEITHFAFSAKCEASRIGALTLLQGVQYPTASVILHFCVDPTYPILDFRAIWSLGIKQPSFYTASFWTEYVNICREVANKHGLAVRELDMALWKYSELHQPTRAT